ncbi:uncharacterized protein H6S33_005005 [Morchella sextelata]|uniref:uncharacterized protein n=1 Tax=Morchella sextelata TaxID=1174677 RepID=UPI001D03CB84|nr:uncharacterized protein H6S33_005005 [Morchella sextelata]KAH0605023.1 hypothetical protein H6S33_005005 [Morchella sextelata]
MWVCLLDRVAMNGRVFSLDPPPTLLLILLAGQSVRLSSFGKYRKHSPGLVIAFCEKSQVHSLLMLNFIRKCRPPRSGPHESEMISIQDIWSFFEVLQVKLFRDVGRKSVWFFCHIARPSQYIQLNTGKRPRYVVLQYISAHVLTTSLSVRLCDGYGVLMPVDHVVQRPGSPHTSRRVIKLGLWIRRYLQYDLPSNVVFALIKTESIKGTPSAPRIL